MSEKVAADAATGSLRAVVTGARGQLGTALLDTTPGGSDARGFVRADCDITDADAVDAVLDQYPCDVLINAAAYTAVDRAEEDATAAMAINGEAPGVLAHACARRGIRLLHVSTDFVFDGQRSTPYPPDADVAPLGAYGRSKLAGELAVRESGADSLIMRTGWVYSLHGSNFLNTMLRLHRERDEISVVDDQIGTPTAARSLAAALWAAARRPSLAGVLHYSDAGVCSWYDFAVAIGEEAENLGLLKQAATVRPIRTADFPTAAQRPPYSVLDRHASWAALDVEPVHWREQLRHTLTDAGTTEEQGTANG